MKISKELLQGINFFDRFHETHLELILPFFELRKVGPKQVVLDQNDLNTCLYFLLEGGVDIYVDNEYVVSLDQEGELFGEISITGHTTCSATVITNCQSLFLVFNFNDVSGLDSNIKNIIDKEVYRSCAEILANKLVQTNEIAKTYRLRALSKNQ